LDRASYRAAVGDDFIICYRMSMADTSTMARSWDEILALATKVIAAGATIINHRHRNWHEGAGSDHRHLGAQQRIRSHQQRSAEHVSIPVVASNRSTCPRRQSRFWPTATCS